MRLRRALGTRLVGVPGAASVLVVDDDPSIRMLCRINLQYDGYDVTEAASLDDARAALAAGGVDVILLDLHLGAEESLPLLEQARRGHPGVAVALLTGTADTDTLREVDADAIIGKPFTIDELTGTVARLAAGGRYAPDP